MLRDRERRESGISSQVVSAQLAFKKVCERENRISSQVVSAQLAGLTSNTPKLCEHLSLQNSSVA